MESYHYSLIYPEDVELPEYKEGDDYDEYQKRLDSVLVRIDHKDVPRKKVRIKVLYFKEVGYQRKGLNARFFEECDNDDAIVYIWTCEELLQYKEKYCDESYEYIYPNGQKSGEMCYPKDNFQRNIIDHFTEGEDVVYVNW